MLTMAYIGNGKSTNRYHLPFSLKRGNIKVKSIFSPVEGPWQKIEGINYTDKIEDLLEDEDIQLVAICTPHETHYDLAKQCLEAGKNVLLEKPFVINSAKARELFALAKEKGLFLQAYQNRRFDSDFLTVQKVIKSGVLGEILEVEMHYDYYRPEIPETILPHFSVDWSYLYAHGCHTIDQVLSFFGNPDDIHYDVRQLLGPGRMNDYFDIDMYFGQMKVSVKSSYFRLKERPSFVVYGKKGVFVKESKDRQEEDLKHFYMPDHADFGLDRPEHYGTVTYLDEAGNYHEEKVISEVGDYSEFYQYVHDSLIHGADKVVKDEETIRLVEILEAGIQSLVNKEQEQDND